MIGKTISHYEVLEKLGRGGMGVVYKARDLNLKRIVALKFLPSHLSTDEDAKQRFIQEAQAASALDHANICTIHEIGETQPGEGEEGGEVYIVMAFYDGQTLKYRMESEDFSVERAANIARQLASGLGRAHEKGIVHRDVKPANIMVTDRDEVKLLDFGLAKLVGGADLTAAGSTLGTAAYMSPEQVRGDDVTSASDVWSLGVLFFEMLCGRRPFTGDYDQAAMYAILNEEAPRVDTIRTDVPTPIADLIARCLDKDVSTRPRSAYEVEAAILDSGVVSGSGATRAVAASAPAANGRPRWLLPAVGAAAVVVVGIVGTFLLSGLDPAPEQASAVTPDPAIAVLPFSVGGDESLDYLRNGMVRLLSTRFDGMGELRSIDPNAVLAQSEVKGSGDVDPQTAATLAGRFNVANFVMGSVLRIGGPIQLSATLYDRDGSARTYAESTIPSDSLLLSAVDDIARQLLAGKFESVSSTKLAVQNTSSFDALRAYLEGEELMHAGRFAEARPRFEEAVALDSTFALAWLRLSHSVGWSNWSDPMYERGLAAANRHSAKLPQRQRELVNIQDLLRSGRYSEGIGRLENIVARHPDDVQALLLLGDYQWHYNAYYGKPASAADDIFRRLLAIDGSVAEARVHLARSVAASGRLDEADSLAGIHNDVPLRMAIEFAQAESKGELTVDMVQSRVQEHGARRVAGAARQMISILSVPRTARDVLDQLPDNTYPFFWRKLADAGSGRYAPLLPYLAKPDTLGASFDLGTALAFYPFEVHELERFRDGLARVDTTVRWSHADSTTILRNGWVFRQFLEALIDWRLGDQQALERRRQRLAARAANDPANDLPFSYAQILRALQLWKAGEITAAEEAFDRSIIPISLRLTSIPFFDLSISRYLRAQMLYDAGRYTKALRWFDSVDDGFMRFSDGNRLHAPSAYRRAQIYEQLGEPAKAIDLYRVFIRMWEEADPVLQPMVDDARQRVDALAAAAAKEPPS